MSGRPTPQLKTLSTNATPTGKNQPNNRLTSPVPKDQKASTASKSNAQFKDTSKTPNDKSPQIQSEELLDSRERSADQRRSIQKPSNKTTPADNKLASSKKPSSVKENEATPKTLPVKAREESTSKDNSTSKKGLSSAQKPVQQQVLFLDPSNPGRVGIRSADKDITDKTNAMSADRNLRSRVDGKLSSRSENVLIGKNKDLETIPIIQEFETNETSARLTQSELKKNLGRFLEDQDTKVQITARTIQQTERKSTSRGTSAKKSRQKPSETKSKGSKGKRSAQNEEQEQIENVEVKVEEIERMIIENVQEQNEEGAVERSGEAGGNVARKEYNLYEDWRILDTIQQLIEKDALTSLSSRPMWNNIEDPLTGRRLLDGNRSSESMRDRFKRYISNIDEAGREAIAEFAETHTPEEMKGHFCVFKKIEGVKQFTAISNQLSYNPEKIQRKTPYGTKSTKQLDKSKDKIEKPYKRKGEGKLEDSFEDEKEGAFERHIPEDIEGLLTNDYMELNEREDALMSRSREASKQKPISMSSTMGQGKISRQGRIPQKSYFEEEKIQESNQPQEFTMIEEPQRGGRNKRKASEYENTSTGPVISQKEMKRVRMDNEYDHSSLHLTAMFGTRKPAETIRRQGEVNRVDEDSLMIYVDLSRGFRQFVKLDPEEEKRRQESMKLNRLADMYQVPLNEVANAFRKVSYDYADLEEYLQKKDPRILWTEEEDGDLLENNLTAIKYLKLIKGEDKVRKRKNFLDRTLA